MQSAVYRGLLFGLDLGHICLGTEERALATVEYLEHENTPFRQDALCHK